MKRFVALTPQQIPALAIAIEDDNVKKYTEWANRFRPFDKAVSGLLDELAKDEIRHRTRSGTGANWNTFSTGGFIRIRSV